MYFKPARSLHISNSSAFYNKKLDIIDPGSFLNDFDLLPQNFVQKHQVEMNPQKLNFNISKLELNSTKSSNFLHLPKIEKKIIEKQTITDQLYFLDQKPKAMLAPRLKYSNTLLLSNDKVHLNSERNLDQPKVKQKKVEFNTALEIVDKNGKITTETIVPDIKIQTLKKIRKLKTLEC